MAVTLQQPVRVGSNAWLISYSSDLPSPVVFRIFQDGSLVATTTLQEYTVSIGAGAAPVIEVLDDPTALPITVFPGRLLLHWRRVDAAQSYRIDRLVGPQFVRQGEVPQSQLVGYYQFLTVFVEDDTVHTFRVVPISNGNDGTPRVFPVLMVRHPDPPVVNYAYNPTDQKVTISS